MNLIRTFFLLALSTTLLPACKSGKVPDQQKIDELKAAHRTKVGLMRITLEPYYSVIPDSMKKWVSIFKKIIADDQKNRFAGYYSLTDEEKAEQQLLDSQNLIIVAGFLDQYGWLTTKETGLIGQQAISMTVQHAPLNTQEKYYPLLVGASQKDSLLLESLALLEDRINMRNRRYQYFGTQTAVHKGKLVLYPVVNIDSIDVFRKRIGLRPVSEYLALMKITFNAEEYKRKSAQLKKQFHITDSAGVYFARNSWMR